MSVKTWRVYVAAMALCAALACAGAFALGGCGGQVVTQDGSVVPMKCLWTFNAVGLVEVVALVAALLGLTTPGVHGRRVCAVLVLLVQLVCYAMLFSPLMGVCAGADMACRQNASVVAALAGVAALVAVVAFARCNPQRKPKRDLLR